jgi:hypothetical protein
MLGKINTVDLYAAGHEFSGGRGVELFQHVELTGPISGITPTMILAGSIEVPSNFFGKSGKHYFSAAYSTQDGVDFSDPYLLLPTTPSPAPTDDRWYFAYAFEQTLWRDANDPKKA